MLVFVNSYREGQTDDFESQGPGTDRLSYLAIEKMAAIKYMWSGLLLNKRKRQLSEDFRFAPETFDINLRTLRPQ